MSVCVRQGKEQMCGSISGRIPVIHAVASYDPRGSSLTKVLNSLWMTGESQWLRWSCFEPFCFGWGGSLGWCAAAATVVLGYQFALLRKDESRSRESPVVTLRWWARCGVLNGSPGDSTKHTGYSHHTQNKVRENRAFTEIHVTVYAKLSTMTPRIMFVTCSVRYKEQQRLASQWSQPPKQTELTLERLHNVPSWLIEHDLYYDWRQFSKEFHSNTTTTGRTRSDAN